MTAANPGTKASRPVRVDPPPPRARRVTIVTPCFNAPDDLAQLYIDLSRLDLTLPDNRRIDADLIVIDNASGQPLAAIPTPQNWAVEVVRLRSNTGGSGGYNTGMALALQRGRERADPPEFLWLLDSDARPHPEALRRLIEAIDTDPAFVIMGSAIARPSDGIVFEIGGKLDKMGQFGPCYGEDQPPPAEVVVVGYAAACSALVRAEAVERVGLFPDVFLNSDDVEWSYRLAQETGGKVGATTRSVVRHPQMKAGITRPRYFMARNAFGPIDALGMGWRVRLLRAMRELPRALAQVMIGREDLAELHLQGLADAASNRLLGAGRLADLKVDPFTPMERAGDALAPHAGSLRGRTIWIHPRIRLAEASAVHLEEALREVEADVGRIPRGEYPLEQEAFWSGVRPALLRCLRGPAHPVAIIPVRGRPNAWCRGRLQIQVTPDGLIVRRCDRLRMLIGAVRVLVRGTWLSIRLAMRKPARSARERLPSASDYAVDREPAS